MSVNSIIFQPGHIGLNVTNINRSAEFYQTVFGFESMGDSSEPGREYAFLGKDGQLILTLWQQSTGAFNKNVVGLHHLSFQIESFDGLVNMHERLVELGIQRLYDGIVPHAEGASSGAVYFEDPDGIRLEIFTATGADNLEMQADGPSCGFF